MVYILSSRLQLFARVHLTPSVLQTAELMRRLSVCDVTGKYVYYENFFRFFKTSR